MTRIIDEQVLSNLRIEIALVHVVAAVTGSVFWLPASLMGLLLRANEVLSNHVRFVWVRMEDVQRRIFYRGFMPYSSSGCPAWLPVTSSQETGEMLPV